MCGVIVIVNVATLRSPIGWQDYELRINDAVIAKFRHKREDGLTKCLQLAAAAAEKAKWVAVAKLLGADPPRAD